MIMGDQTNKVVIAVSTTKPNVMLGFIFKLNSDYAVASFFSSASVSTFLVITDNTTATAIITEHTV